MKRAALFLPLILLAGCARQNPFRPGDTLLSVSDGSVLGKVIEFGPHSFPNGASGQSVHVQLPSGGDAWYTLDTTRVGYRAKP